MKRNVLSGPVTSLAALASALVLALALAPGCTKAPSVAALPPLPVVAAEVLVRDTPVYVEYIGQTLGSRDVEVRARVEGFLDGVHFDEGTAVASNALLYTIDAKPFEAALEQARGALAQAQAQVDKSRRDTNRLGPLWEKNAISRQQYDDAIAAERNATAVAQSARASVDSATIQLGYTRIHSPIAGLVGKTEVKAGNLVGRGANTLLTTVSEIDPISVRFAVSEQQYLEWKRRHGDDTRSRDAARGLFELVLADGTRHGPRGSVTFADRQVDPRTGTLLLEVSFPNPERLVRPGQFARVRFPMTVVTNAVLVPQRAVQELQATYSVYVVGSDGRASFRKVTPGARIGSFQIITDGLAAGDRVVIEGLQKLQNNAPVAAVVTNLVLPADAGGSTR